MYYIRLLSQHLYKCLALIWLSLEAFKLEYNYYFVVLTSSYVHFLFYMVYLYTLLNDYVM